jgi:hypothetical protein
LVHDREYIDTIFQSLNTTDAALRLLEDTGLDPDRPHHRPQSRNSNRRNIVITLCADRRGANPMHRITMVGVNTAGRELTYGLGLECTTRQASGSGRSWRFETVRRDFGELMKIASAHPRRDGRTLCTTGAYPRSLAALHQCRSDPTREWSWQRNPADFDVVERVEHDGLRRHGL